MGYVFDLGIFEYYILGILVFIEYFGLQYNGLQEKDGVYVIMINILDFYFSQVIRKEVF